MFSLAISIFTCNLSSPPKECEYTVLFVNNDLPILGNFVLMEDDTSFWVLNLVDDDGKSVSLYSSRFEKVSDEYDSSVFDDLNMGDL